MQAEKFPCNKKKGSNSSFKFSKGGRLFPVSRFLYIFPLKFKSFLSSSDQHFISQVPQLEDTIHFHHTDVSGCSPCEARFQAAGLVVFRIPCWLGVFSSRRRQERTRSGRKQSVSDSQVFRSSESPGGFSAITSHSSCVHTYTQDCNPIVPLQRCLCLNWSLGLRHRGILYHVNAHGPAET